MPDVYPMPEPRYVAESNVFLGLFDVRDTHFEGPGSVFSAPIVRRVTSMEAAERIADELNRYRPIKGTRIA